MHAASAPRQTGSPARGTCTCPNLSICHQAIDSLLITWLPRTSSKLQPVKEIRCLSTPQMDPYSSHARIHRSPGSRGDQQSCNALLNSRDLPAAVSVAPYGSLILLLSELLGGRHPAPPLNLLSGCSPDGLASLRACE